MDPSPSRSRPQIAKDYKIIAKPATDDAYRTDIAEAAMQELKDDGVDVNGEDWKKETVEVTPGGE